MFPIQAQVRYPQIAHRIRRHATYKLPGRQVAIYFKYVSDVTVLPREDDYFSSSWSLAARLVQCV